MAVVTDKTYYRALGRRITERRKALGITQVQLAEQLGVAQQTMAHYEGGTLRVAVALLPPLARTLRLSLEELVGDDTPAAKTAGKRGPMPTCCSLAAGRSATLQPLLRFLTPWRCER